MVSVGQETFDGYQFKTQASSICTSDVSAETIELQLTVLLACSYLGGILLKVALAKTGVVAILIGWSVTESSDQTNVQFVSLARQ